MNDAPLLPYWLYIGVINVLGHSPQSSAFRLSAITESNSAHGEVWTHFAQDGAIRCQNILVASPCHLVELLSSSLRNLLVNVQSKLHHFQSDLANVQSYLEASWCQLVPIIKLCALFLLDFVLKTMGQPRPLFGLFSVFPIKHCTISQQINVKNVFPGF